MNMIFIFTSRVKRWQHPITLVALLFLCGFVGPGTCDGVQGLPPEVLTDDALLAPGTYQRSIGVIFTPPEERIYDVEAYGTPLTMRPILSLTLDSSQIAASSLTLDFNGERVTLSQTRDDSRSFADPNDKTALFDLPLVPCDYQRGCAFDGLLTMRFAPRGTNPEFSLRAALLVGIVGQTPTVDWTPWQPVAP